MLRFRWSDIRYSNIFRRCEMLAMEHSRRSHKQPILMIFLMIYFVANICAPLNGDQAALQKEGMHIYSKPKNRKYVYFFVNSRFLMQNY